VSPKATSSSLQGRREVVRCRGRDVVRCRGGWGRHCASSRFDFLQVDLHGPLPMGVASSYPVTPLAGFALGSEFDRWAAIKAPNLGQPGQPCRPCQSMPAWTPSGRQVDGRGLVHVWSTTHWNPAVASGTSFAQPVHVMLGKSMRRSPSAEQWTALGPVALPISSAGVARQGHGSLIRMQSEVQVLAGEAFFARRRPGAAVSCRRPRRAPDSPPQGNQTEGRMGLRDATQRETSNTLSGLLPLCCQTAARLPDLHRHLAQLPRQPPPGP
jgi:hypothetical protein